MDRFTIVDTLDRERWDAFVQEHPKGSIFHTAEMLDVHRGTRHHRPFFLAALDEAGDVLALLVSVRVQTLPGPLGWLSSRSIFYAEPLCRDSTEGEEALVALLEEHDAVMRKRTLFAEVRPLCAPGTEKAALTRCGHRYEDYLNFLTDLRLPEDDLWRRIGKSTRGNIRRSQKQGVRVEDVTTADGVDILYSLLQFTFGRVRVPLADKSLFTGMLSILPPRNMARILVAYQGDVPIAADALLLHKRTAYMWYKGVARVQSLDPSACLIWREMEWGKQQGYEILDFGGAGWPNKPYGVRDAKARFGGELVCYGRYRKVYSAWKFSLAERAYELLRRARPPKSWATLPFLRRIHGTTAV